MTVTIFHPSHPHYAVHKAFVDGSFANPDCPPVVQMAGKYTNGTDFWVRNDNPEWLDSRQYRIKPRTITRTVTYPEPLREAPANGTEVWLVCTHIPLPEKSSWVGSHFQLQTLKNGMCFTTEADAQQCYGAYFGEQK